MQRTFTPSSDSEKRRPITAGEVIIENLQKDGIVKRVCSIITKENKKYEEKCL